MRASTIPPILLAATLTSTPYASQIATSPYSISPRIGMVESISANYPTVSRLRVVRGSILSNYIGNYSTHSMPKIEDELKSSDNLLKQVRQIVSAQFFALTKVQQNVTISLVREILQRIDPKGFNLGFSDENEVQLYRKVANGNLYLLVDEYGGIALNFVGRPGKGTSSLYIDDEDVDTRKIIQVAYKFTRLT